MGNAGYEWHGYLRYLIDHYDALPSRTIFLQANPETAPPSVGASRPGAAANAPSSTPRQRQIELRAASSLSRFADLLWLADHTGLDSHDRSRPTSRACSTRPSATYPCSRSRGCSRHVT